MTIFTHGNDKGFVLPASILLLFLLSAFLLSLLELEYRRFLRIKSDYEVVCTQYKGEIDEID